MPSRWSILALLFAVRGTMPSNFRASPPLLSRDLALAFADIGLLIGLYLAPGAALALPGGAIGRKFGDKAAVFAGLALMIAGGLVMALSPL
jgi:MFS family permease